MKTFTGKNKLPLPFKHEDAFVYHGFLGKSRDNFYFGVELEYELFPKKGVADRSEGYLPSDFEEDKKTPIRKHINTINKTVGTHAIIKDDGSIEYGVEIASAPATYEKHRTIWRSFFDNHKEFGLQSLNNCGMHVHVSRKDLTNQNIFDIKSFVYANKKAIEKIAGRKENEYCNYYACDLQDFIENGEEFYGEKYEAVNTCPDNTIEFRIFKAPKNEEEFLIRLQFVKSLVKFIVSQNTKEKTWDLFKKFVSKHKTFKNLKDFIKDKNL